jgi:prolyl-tRNA editing enzyme YbaK/EbsC (Cys-tRNA(Pro) deacylase)
MLDTIVRYLHESNVPFRLSSYPSPENRPAPVHAIPPHAMLVDARFIAVDGRLVLACVRAGNSIDLAALGSELGGTAVEALPDDLPEALLQFDGAVPPLGKLLGVPLIVDEMIEGCATLVFRGFGQSDYIEVPYDDFARLEQPRIASFARAGELEAPPAARQQRSRGAPTSH